MPREKRANAKLTAADRENLETIIRAAKNNDLAAMMCQDARTGEDIAVICAVGEELGKFIMTPLARLFKGNPYEELNPPKPEGGYMSQEEQNAPPK